MTKQEKELMTAQYRMVYGENDKMIKYCVGKISDIVYLPDGIFVIDKPSIHTDFCFGYHDYTTEEGMNSWDGYNGAQERADKAEKDTEYFIRKNLERSNIDDWIEILKDEYRPLYLRIKYSRQTEECKLLDITDYWNRQRVPENPDGRPLTAEERALIVKGYESAKEKFIKRLNTYLKRYGMSKVNTWTYWLDE